MKSLSFRHSNTHIFLRHTSCACSVRDTPETEASPVTSTISTMAIMQEKAHFVIWLAEGKSIMWVQRRAYKRDLLVG